jgi:anaerobic selenocysteine-containing dehydrogenase
LVLLAEKLANVRQSGHPERLSCIADSDHGTTSALIKRFMTAFGSPNFHVQANAQDAYEMATYVMNGTMGPVGQDLKNSDYVLSFGSGFLEGWGSPVRVIQANAKWRDRHAKVVQVEPRLSNSAAKADQWVPVNPGTEAVLAMGIASEIVANSFYSRYFVSQYTQGFDAWSAMLNDQYSPDKVAEVTGVDPALISELAKSFAGAQRPVALFGRGQGDNPGALPEAMAVHALNALVANFNAKGGVWMLPPLDYIEWPDPEMDQVAAEGMQQPRSDGAAQGEFAQSKYLLSRLPELIANGQAVPPEVMMLAGSNPLYTLPNSDVVKAAFDKISFIVSFSSYMDESAQAADLILPQHTYLEAYQDVPAPAGFPQPLIGLARPVASPVYNTRYLGDVIIELAAKLGSPLADAFAWENYETCLQETMGDRWEAMLDEGHTVDQQFTPGGWDQAFETGSGKFEFQPDSIDTAVTVAEPPGDADAFPFLLIPYDSMRLTNGPLANPPFLTKTVAGTILKNNEIMVEINPETAGQLSLTEGSLAQVTTAVGQAKVRVHLFNGIKPGVVAIPTGLGHTAFDDFIADKGVNAKALMASVEDPVSGLDAAWGIRAKVTKA